jgi:hypothetical protein
VTARTKELNFATLRVTLHFLFKLGHHGYLMTTSLLGKLLTTGRSPILPAARGVQSLGHPQSLRLYGPEPALTMMTSRNPQRFNTLNIIEIITIHSARFCAMLYICIFPCQVRRTSRWICGMLDLSHCL